MQNNFFGSKLNTVLLLILIILVSGVLYIMFQNKEIYMPGVQEKEIVDTTMPAIENKDKIFGNKDDLISFSILPDSRVHGVVSYRGVIKGAYFFEANILIRILDLNKNVLKTSNAMATSEWMTAGPVDFEGNNDFSDLPKGPAYFEIHNDNASGLPEHDKRILIPIIIE